MSIGLVPTLFLAFSGRIADISDILGGSVENRAGVERVGEVAVGAASRMQHCVMHYMSYDVDSWADGTHGAFFHNAAMVNEKVALVTRHATTILNRRLA